MKRVVRYCWIILLGLMTTPVLAQFPVTDNFDRPAERIDTVRILGLKSSPCWVVKLNPLSLIDFESTYRFDVERMLGGVFSVQGGLGYGTGYGNSLGARSNNLKDRETWRAQFEGRMYLRRDRPASNWYRYRKIYQKPLEAYLGLESFYKQVNAPYTGTLSRGCEDGSCQFFEQYTARAVRYVSGFHVKFGQQTAVQLSETNSRLLIDYYVGLGVRWRWFRQYGIPFREDSNTNTSSSPFFDPTSSFSTRAGRFASLAMGIQLGYAF